MRSHRKINFNFSPSSNFSIDPQNFSREVFVYDVHKRKNFKNEYLLTLQAWNIIKTDININRWVEKEEAEVC